MDATDPIDVKLLQHIESIKTFDVILFNNVLMVTCKVESMEWTNCGK